MLAAARDMALSKIGDDGINKLSDRTHFTVQKASSNFQAIPTTAASGYALTPDMVRSDIVADISKGLVPLYLCATVGTTAVGAVDPLLDLGNVANEYGVWYHVDAAYAGSSAICPEFRHHFDGVELADSFSVNAYKWFLTNLECCCLWVRSPSALVDLLSTYPEILGNKASDAKKAAGYKDWPITLSRRFRAMKLWVVIRRQCGQLDGGCKLERTSFHDPCRGGRNICYMGCDRSNPNGDAARGGHMEADSSES